MALLLPPRSVARSAPVAVSQTLTVESALPVATRSAPVPSYLTHDASDVCAVIFCRGLVGTTTEILGSNLRELLFSGGLFSGIGMLALVLVVEDKPNHDVRFSSSDFRDRSMSTSFFSLSHISDSLFISPTIFSLSETSLVSSNRFSFLMESFSSCSTRMVFFKPTYCCSASFVLDLASVSSLVKCSIARSFRSLSSFNFFIVSSWPLMISLFDARSFANSRAEA
mmetsp:Transcript_77716/g.217830  ORF Transcript_77716/g.217830 Transcript_77716/m.217830 type:complete len:225 (-) Transcript_77716:222-896(-)